MAGFEYAAPAIIIAHILFPILKRTPLFRENYKGFFFVGIISSVVVLLPFRGLSVGDYVLSFNPVFSMGTLMFLLFLLWEKATDRKVFSEREKIIFAAFNVLLYIPLSASSLGFTGGDIYKYGYGFSIWFILMGIITVVSIVLKSSLSYIFISYIAAYDLGLLPSPNFFDYVSDGPLFFISAFILLKYLYERLKGKKNGLYKTASTAS